MPETEVQRAAAFDRLADERLDASYRLATAILRDDELAKDAVHDAVVTAWHRWPSLRDRSKFEAWFDRIVVNTARDRLREVRRRRTTDIDAAATMSTPDGTVDVHRRLLVEESLDRLKPDDIVVLTLRHFLDLQLDDIAVLLDTPVSTANSRLRSARDRLRVELEKQLPDQVTK